MAHFAKLGTGNIVERVEVVSNDIATSEQAGVDFLNNLYKSRDVWKKTSYNHKFRKTFAGKGMVYNEEYDAFITSQPFPSWTLNTETLDWDPPTSMPELTEEEIASFSLYFWDEDAYNEVGEGWKLFTPELPPELPPEEEPVGIAST